MSTIESRLAVLETRTGRRRLATPALLALLITAVALAVIVTAGSSAFDHLGAGRGLVPEEGYAVWGFVLVLATTIGIIVGWAGGSALVLYVSTLAGRAPTWGTVRVAMTVAYLGLLALPLLLYHAFFGGWLLGLARPGVPAWLSEHDPSAYWLLVTLHTPIDFALIPLAIAFLVLLWGFGERTLGEPRLQTLLWLVIFLSALAVALSLTIHSTLVHLRIS